MVVTAHPMASAFGLEILKSGGNAVDAAVGSALAIGVFEPNASGLGGGGAMLVYLHEPDSLAYINYYARAPRFVPTDFDGRREYASAAAVLVPGTVAGLHRALTDYGTFTWKDMLNRAIDCVRDGFPLDEKLHRIIFDSYEKLQAFPQTADTYLVDGLPPEIGHIIINPRIVHTLEVLAEEGPNAFYRGAVADSIESAIRLYGGGLRKEDLASYSPRVVGPLRGIYRNRVIVSAPPPQSGLTVIETLNILEHKNLGEMGPYTSNVRTFHFMAEAMKRAHADRHAYLGDPEFCDVPVEILTSKAFARSRYKTIRMKKAEPSIPMDTAPADVAPFMKTKQPVDEHASTTHISVVDRQGNAVSLTQTLNQFWGSGLSVCGFPLNNGMTVFSGANPVNRVSSGRQPRTTIAPTMMFEEGRLIMVVGSPGGGRIITTLVEIICNIIDFGMDADAANNTARFCGRKWAQTVPVESRFPEDFLNALRAMGHPIEIRGELDLFFGGAQLITIDPETGTLAGSSDPRRSGTAMGFKP